MGRDFFPDAMPPHGRLLVVELVLPSGEEPFVGTWLDLHVLVLQALLVAAQRDRHRVRTG